MKDKDVSKQKVFISQPMNGLSDEYILNKRSGIEKFLNMNGYTVIDSYIKDDSKNSIEMLGMSIELLGQADIVYFSKGWRDSRGCNIEYNVSRDYGIPSTENLEDFITGEFE